MIHLYGPYLPAAESDSTLLAKLKNHIPLASAISVQQIFFIDAVGQLSDQQCGLLTKLLPIGHPPLNNSAQVIVLPNLGQASDWSLQMTKLAHDCGLTAIKSIYKGQLYCIESAAQSSLDLKVFSQVIELDIDQIFDSIMHAVSALNESMVSCDKDQQQQRRTILSRRQPMLHASWQTADGQTHPAWFDVFNVPVSEFVQQRYADYAVVFSGREAPFRQIDPETHVYTLRQEQRHVSFQLASRCQANYGCSLLGEVGRGNTIKAALLGILTHNAPDQAELRRIKQRAKLNNARGVPTLCGFWQPGLSVKTQMISGEYGYIRPDHMEVGASTDLVYVLVDQVETFRSAQTVVERCVELGHANPICEVRLSRCQQPIFCIDQGKLSRFIDLASREGCQYQILTDFDHIESISSPLVLKPMDRLDVSIQQVGVPLPISALSSAILSAPAVADKSFLVRHFDRSVGGLVARDAMVGVWQVPISNVAVTCQSFQGFSGEAIAMGEKLCQRRCNLAASARMAVVEAVTNLLSADIRQLENIVINISMISSDAPTLDLYEASQALVTFCQQVGLEIGMTHHVKSSDDQATGFAITAFSRLPDVRMICQPRLRRHIGPSHLILVDLGLGEHRLAGSVCEQVADQQLDRHCPDVEAETLRRFIEMMLVLHQNHQVQAYHDRSDGGLFVTLSELMFAARVGLNIFLDTLDQAYIAALFCEEAGVVLQVQEDDLDEVLSIVEAYDLPAHVLGSLRDDQCLVISHNDQVIFDQDRAVLQKHWANYGMQLAQDQTWLPFAKAEHDLIDQQDDAGLTASLTFNMNQDIAAPFINKGHLPKVAILRQQDGFGQIEMAVAFEFAGFKCIDVHINDLKSGQLDLSDFQGLAITGAFSYNDVLGAGVGWAKTILLNSTLVTCFSQFFERHDTFTLAIGNGAQLLTHLRDLIPGSSAWPYFHVNQSGRYEARLSMVEIIDSNSIFMQGMAGSQLPIVVSHASGQAQFKLTESAAHLSSQNQIVLQYIDQAGQATEAYPFNPDGSTNGVAAFCSLDGRVMAMMPHVERAFRTVQFSWHPHEWGEFSPWMQIFRNARVWVG